MGRRSREPGPIGVNRARQNRARTYQNMEWRRLDLANAIVVQANNLGAASQTTNGVWTVSVTGGVKSWRAGDGPTWYWPMSDLWSFDDIQLAAISIEVTDNTGLSYADFYIEAGISPNPSALPSAKCMFAGLHYDHTLTTGVDIRAGLGSAITGNDSAPQLNTVGVVGRFEVGPARRASSSHAYAVTNISTPTFKYTKRATANLNITESDGNFGFFLSLGRSSTDPDTNEIKFKVHGMISSPQPAWFP